MRKTNKEQVISYMIDYCPQGVSFDYNKIVEDTGVPKGTVSAMLSSLKKIGVVNSTDDPGMWVVIDDHELLKFLDSPIPNKRLAVEKGGKIRRHETLGRVCDAVLNYEFQKFTIKELLADIPGASTSTVQRIVTRMVKANVLFHVEPSFYKSLGAERVRKFQEDPTIPQDMTELEAPEHNNPPIKLELQVQTVEELPQALEKLSQYLLDTVKENIEVKKENLLLKSQMADILRQFNYLFGKMKKGKEI